MAHQYRGPGRPTEPGSGSDRHPAPRDHLPRGVDHPGQLAGIGGHLRRRRPVGVDAADSRPGGSSGRAARAAGAHASTGTAIAQRPGGVERLARGGRPPGRRSPPAPAVRGGAGGPPRHRPPRSRPAWDGGHRDATEGRWWRRSGPPSSRRRRGGRHQSPGAEHLAVVAGDQRRGQRAGGRSPALLGDGGQRGPQRRHGDRGGEGRAQRSDSGSRAPGGTSTAGASAPARRRPPRRGRRLSRRSRSASPRPPRAKSRAWRPAVARWWRLRQSNTPFAPHVLRTPRWAGGGQGVQSRDHAVAHNPGPPARPVTAPTARRPRTSSPGSAHGRRPAGRGGRRRAPAPAGRDRGGERRPHPRREPRPAGRRRRPRRRQLPTTSGSTGWPPGSPTAIVPSAPTTAAGRPSTRAWAAASSAATPGSPTGTASSPWSGAP